MSTTGVPTGGATPAVSADGKRFVYSTMANDAAAGDTNDAADIYMRKLTVPAQTSLSLRP